MKEKSYFEGFNSWIKNSITFKLFTTGFLILILLIPTYMIRFLIHERENRHNITIEEISSKWAREQTIAGPILTVPYGIYSKDKGEKVIKSVKYAHFLPDELNIDGNISPEIRYRGIYETVVYKSNLKFTGKFSSPDFKDLNIPDDNILWEDAFVSLGIPDMRGIEKNIEINLNKIIFAYTPGIETNDIINPGLSAPFPIKDADNPEKNYEYSFDINLKGSKELNFIPLGKETNVKLTSNWNNPSFDGAFLPYEREITNSGFNAKWNVLYLNRDYPQKWKGNSYNIFNSAFGVKLLMPVDEYQKTMRSVKYAVMFISLTFMIFFFVEVINKKRIHPVQYILVGLALVIFFTLLLSLSEHINFNFAYLIASIATILLITAYSKTIFKSNFLTILMGSVLLILYGFMYTILQLQDYSLLLGSIGLFIVLAVTMYLSRKIDWYSLSSNSNINKE